jgi:hypothetical protein
VRTLRYTGWYWFSYYARTRTHARTQHARARGIVAFYTLSPPPPILRLRVDDSCNPLPTGHFFGHFGNVGFIGGCTSKRYDVIPDDTCATCFSVPPWP